MRLYALPKSPMPETKPISILTAEAIDGFWSKVDRRGVGCITRHRLVQRQSSNLEAHCIERDQCP
jgi:hypothetical protein